MRHASVLLADPLPGVAIVHFLDVMTAMRKHGAVERRKTGVYLDPDVLTATKVVAAARQQARAGWWRTP